MSSVDSHEEAGHVAGCTVVCHVEVVGVSQSSDGEESVSVVGGSAFYGSFAELVMLFDEGLSNV